MAQIKDTSILLLTNACCNVSLAVRFSSNTLYVMTAVGVCYASSIRKSISLEMNWKSFLSGSSASASVAVTAAKQSKAVGIRAAGA